MMTIPGGPLDGELPPYMMFVQDDDTSQVPTSIPSESRIKPGQRDR